jgi:hypothetical protein
MRVRIHQLLALVLLVIVTAIYLNGTRILGPTENFKYLSDLGNREGPSAWNEYMYGKPGSWGSMSAYEALDREYERERNYGLLDHETEAAYRRKFQALAQNALKSWQRYQADTLAKGLTRKLDERFEIKSFFEGNSPLMALGIVAAAYTGRTMRYHLSDRSTIESRTLMEGSKLTSQYLGYSNRLLAASLGATYAEGHGSLVVSKAITPEVSVNYQNSGDHAVGVTYSRGF